MKINVKQLTGQQFYVDIDGTDSVSKLKSRIEDVCNIPVLQQRLIYAGRELVDNALVNSYNIFEGKTVHLVMRRNVGPSMYGTNAAAPQTPHNSVMDLEAQQSAGQLNARDGSGRMDVLASGANMSQDEITPLNSNNAGMSGSLNNNDLEANNNMMNADDAEGARIFDVMELARACRLIRLFAIIDCVLMVLFAFWGDLLFLAGVPLAICGYFGAKNLKRGALFLYGIFILLSIAFRVYLSYVYPTWLMILLTVISVLLELYVFKQTIRLFRMIPRLTPHDQRMLQQMSDMFI